MTRPRSTLVDLDATSYYHCVCRCVRRAFLWGNDRFSGKDFSHRKTWVVERLDFLSEIFTIDIAAYAVMSNHYHLVLRVDRERSRSLTNNEVAARWSRLFSLPLVVERSLKGETSNAENECAQELIALWRERLSDLSWYMRALNEHIARRANAEDQCKGRFWEGRFKSQALLDAAAVLTAMSYVDLNPIRAGIADLPESSEFTSIQQRILEWRAQDNSGLSDDAAHHPSLMPLRTKPNPLHPHALRFNTTDYLELVDWAGRAIRNDKRGAIARSAPSIV